uniref:EF-hand domain-containing protein n=1 Tax=Arion vulgaris TaxID=1028688 RepID=A0A0B7BKP7_9EUPU
MAYMQRSISSEDMMTEPNQAMIDQMQEVMSQKAVELFRLCDKEEKGFITKSDMQRLRAELPVSPDQLEVVFDSLDDDGNGFLSLQEFTDGFGSFLGLKSPNSSRDDNVDEMEPTMYEGEYGTTDPAMEEKMFTEMIHHIGASHIFQDEEVVKAMWLKLHREEPDMSSTFEEFIARLAGDIKKSKVDFLSLESALLSKSNEHEEEVKKLYEEMELQIKEEKERILAEERAKERHTRSELESQLKEREKQLQDILTKHQEMEQKLENLNKTDVMTKQENDRLQKERDMLEEMLGQSQNNLDESRSYIQQMQMQQKDEKRERARAALMLSEGIAIERESLVKQLDLLKDVNKKLRDDKDEADATDIRRDGPLSLDAEVKNAQGNEPQKSNSTPRKELHKQGSVLSNYFPGERAPHGRSTELVSVDLDVDGLYDGEDGSGSFDAESLFGASVFIPDDNEDPEGALEVDDTIGSLGGQRSKNKNLRRQHHHSSSEDDVGLGEDGGSEDKKIKKVRAKLLMHKRSQPVGADSQIESYPPKPQRIFKVVFVGDSGVGKSSFIHRFCHQEFKPNFSTTIGVDFQIKTLDVKDSTVILQLWDTAGQERFRSMTKAYFRKADGIIVMYDVAVESTFTSVRNWMNSVQEHVEPGTVIMLLGNKLDISEDDAKRPVKQKDGLVLAVEWDMLFYETSAKSGTKITESMEALASLLQEKEDKKIEDGLKLTDDKPKKRCCRR